MPSRGRYYTEDIYVKKFSTLNIKNLSTINEKNANYIINSTISSCVLNIDTNKILVGDKLWFIFYLRALTYDDLPFQIKHKCEHCENTVNLEFTLKNLKVDYLDKDVPAEFITEQGKYADMLAAYNWGPGNYEKSGLHGNVEAGDYEKLNSETKDYVTKIIGAVYGDKAKIMESNDDYKKKNETEEEDNSTNDNSASTSTSTSSSSNTNLSSSSNSSDSYSESSSSGGFGNFSQDQISKLQAAPIYKNGSAEYSNQTTQYDPTKYSGYDPVEGNVKIDYQGFARQTATSLYNSMNLDKYAKEIAENAQKVNSADRNRQKFETYRKDFLEKFHQGVV